MTEKICNRVSLGTAPIIVKNVKKKNTEKMNRDLYFTKLWQYAIVNK
jgi:hypothetical protein